MDVDVDVDVDVEVLVDDEVVVQVNWSACSGANSDILCKLGYDDSDRAEREPLLFN